MLTSEPQKTTSFHELLIDFVRQIILSPKAFILKLTGFVVKLRKNSLLFSKYVHSMNTMLQEDRVSGTRPTNVKSIKINSKCFFCIYRSAITLLTGHEIDQLNVRGFAKWKPSAKCEVL